MHTMERAHKDKRCASAERLEIYVLLAVSNAPNITVQNHRSGFRFMFDLLLFLPATEHADVDVAIISAAK